MSTVPPPETAGRLSVVVIAYNDEELVGEAVRSALAQGPVVAEVVAVDDRSDDGTARVLDELAARHPRLRVVRRTENSGGCGTPRNDGIAAATAPYVMFLDSDDVLPPGAAEALVAAAERHRAPVAVGVCVRRELPEGRDVRWQPGLYREPAVLETPGELRPLVHDTLCVNKVYERAFLDAHDIRFPDGRFVYEDFLFTARVYAAAPRVAVVPDTVYVWHVRRSAARLSISLDRKDVSNWRSRVAAHRAAVETFAGAGRTDLAAACRTKFLEHDLRMYARDLRRYDADHRAEWWEVTREHLAGFREPEIAAAVAPARWAARFLLAAKEPCDLLRLSRLCARPPRLLAPYAGTRADAVWSEELPEVRLDGMDRLPLDELPLVVDAVLRPGDLTLTARDLYGRLAEAGPRTAEIAFLPRGGAGPVHTERVDLRAVTGEDGAEAHWTGRAPVRLNRLVGAGRRLGRRGVQLWDFTTTVTCANGESYTTALRPVAGTQRRSVLPSSRYGVLLVQQYTTANGSLAVRMVSGARDGFRVVRARFRRFVRSSQ
ncbi:glycosyltransferase family 2 protein [Streptomyces sp. bgisy095]|uniref:glycosyltransferase family 2 protein n=1 Tax=unclassified Streptomyces TaxID=2593676 RepID=UPI003D719BEA